MDKANQIPQAAKTDFDEGLRLIERLQRILSEIEKKKNKQFNDLERKYRNETYTSNTAHVQFIQQLIEELSSMKYLSPQIEEWIYEAKLYINKRNLI